MLVDNINFKGRFRYMKGTILSLNYVPLYEVGKDRVSKELVELASKSKFLNKLKENGDVFLFHHKEIYGKETPWENGFLARLFFRKKTEKTNKNKIGKEHLSVVFVNKKSDNIKDTELCKINITLPLNKKSPKNLNRFDRILKNNTNIEALRESADKNFPDNSHKLALLNNGGSHSWIEFWTGQETGYGTLNRLLTVLYIESINILKDFVQNIKK